MESMRDKFFACTRSEKIARYRKKELGEENIKFENYKMRMHGMERESPGNDSSGKFIVMIFFMLPSLAIIIIEERSHTHTQCALFSSLSIFFSLSSRLIPYSMCA